LDQDGLLSASVAGRRGRSIAVVPKHPVSRRQADENAKQEELVRFGFGLKTLADWFNSVFQGIQFGVVRFDR